jgi:hypothetical protein
MDPHQPMGEENIFIQLLEPEISMLHVMMHCNVLKRFHYQS